MKKLHNFFLLLIIYSSSFYSFAMNIDGLLNESEWENAQEFDDFLTVYPNNQSKPKYKTNVKYFSTSEGIYFGITNSQPISEQTLQQHSRDYFYADVDRVVLMIDFEGKGNVGYEFTVSLGDSLRDAIVINENEISQNWDSIWFAKTHQNSNEWFAEYFIPWGVAPIPEETSDKRKLKITVARKVHQDAEYYNSSGLWVMQTPFLSKFQTIYVDNYELNKENKSFEFFPYISTTNDFIENNSSINIGGELFWDIDFQSKLDISINPDFGQVESDDVIVNFSANETFYPDKRPFFTENQSLFEITGQDLRFINTRRIGAIPDKCSNTDKSHLGQCSDYRNDSTDINAALRYTKKGKINEYGFFVALEDNTIFSKGRDFFSGRFKRNLNNSKGTVGYLVTSVDRPSINRKAFVNTLDFDYKPSGSSRLYGWLSNANVKEEGIESNGYGFRLAYSNRSSKNFFSNYFINYHDKNFNINDMGYIKKYDNISVGANYDIERTNKNKNSLISQTILEFDITHDRSDKGNYSGGIDFDVFYELQYKDSSSLKFACYCNFIGGVDFEETRKNPGSPFIENLPGAYMYVNYRSPSTSKIQSTYKVAYGTFGYETEDSNTDLRNESFTVAYSNVFKPSSNVQLNIEWFEYQTRSNWSIWRENNLFGYFDKEQISSSLSLDIFRGNNQEFRIKGKIYGIKAKNPRSYRVSSNGYMNASTDNMEAFQLSETAFQIRYKYEFSPLSNLYVVYTRGGKLSSTFNQKDNFSDLYSGAWTNQTLDKFIIKMRLKF